MEWHIISNDVVQYKVQHYLLQSYYNACVSLCLLCPMSSGQLQWVPVNENQHWALGYKTHSAWQCYKTTKSGAKRRTQSAEPRNVMFFGCVFSVKVLTVIMLHWRYAEMREAFHLRPCNCESTNHLWDFNIHDSRLILLGISKTRKSCYNRDSSFVEFWQ